MKHALRPYFLLLILLIGNISYAQPPSQFSYQAVVRDATGKLVENQVVNMQISILKGSETGTVVYSETQAPKTNASGLLSIHIGAGTGSTGDIGGINWSDGNYFLKTELSLTDDAKYTISSTNQILSVPYAISAHSADELTSLDLHVNADTLYVTKNNYLVIPGLRLLGQFKNIQLLLNSGFTPLQLYSLGYPLDSLYGKTYQGGILFWLDINTGHGLIAAPKGYSIGLKLWSDISILRPRGASGDWINTSTDFGTGQANTTSIVNALGLKRSIDGKVGTEIDADYAAADCDRLVTGGYDDWYLPSQDELLLLSKNIGVSTNYPGVNPSDLGKAEYLVDKPYWTSSLAADGKEIYVIRDNNIFTFYSSQSALVQPIRSF